MLRVALASAVLKRCTTAMNLSLAALKEALAIREQIDDLERRLAAIFNDPVESKQPTVRRQRTMSAAGRARISAAAKARWAKRGGKQPTSTGKPASAKGGITAAGRKRLSEAMKARWAARKTGGR